MPDLDPTSSRRCRDRRPAKELSASRRPVVLRPAVLVPFDEASARLAIQALQDLLIAYENRASKRGLDDLTRAGRDGLLDGDTAREDTP